MSFLFQSLYKRSALPCVASPTTGCTISVDQCCAWLQEHRDAITTQLHDAGAILFRNVAMRDTNEFRELCQSISGDLKNYVGGDSPRREISDQVYTSTEYAAEHEIRLHNELCYADWCPDWVFFGCLIAPERGGETHLGDGRQLFRLIDPVIRGRFIDRGIKYLQVLRDADDKPGPGKTWQDTFETRSREVVEWRLKNSQISFQWTDHGLKTSAFHDAVVIHPVTGHMCWHNQADHWHRDLLSIKDSTHESAATEKSPTSGTEHPGHHVTFGDDSEIDVDDLLHIRSVASQCEVMFRWQEADFLIIDNTSTLHGRKPFSGQRRIVVAMA